MFCARLEKEIESKECPPIITAIRVGESLKVCQECPQGIALAGYAQIRPNYYKPQEQNMSEEKAEYKATEEHVMASDERKSITLPELCELSGVVYSSANRIKRGLDQRGRNKQKLDAALAELGLTWANVEKIPNNKRNQRNASQKAAAAHNREKTMAEAVQAMTTEAAATDVEPEDEPSPAPSYIPPAPNYARDFPLSHIPMEAIVAEITRRVPRAEVILR